MKSYTYKYNLDGVQASLDQMNLESKIEFEEIKATLNYYNDTFSNPLTPFFRDDDKIPVPPKSPKPIQKSRINTVSESDTKPISTALSLIHDPLIQNIWSYIITFLDSTSIAYFKCTGRLINLTPIFLELQSSINLKKAEYEYQLFLHSLPKPKVIYYSRASLFAGERTISEIMREAEAKARLPDLFNNSDDGHGFVIPGRKV
jgi:hypothetical protein